MNRFFGNPHFKSYGELLHRLHLLMAKGQEERVPMRYSVIREQKDVTADWIRKQMESHSDHLNSDEIQALKFISTAYEAEIARQKGT